MNEFKHKLLKAAQQVIQAKIEKNESQILAAIKAISASKHSYLLDVLDADLNIQQVIKETFMDDYPEYGTKLISYYDADMSMYENMYVIVALFNWLNERSVDLQLDAVGINIRLFCLAKVSYTNGAIRFSFCPDGTNYIHPEYTISKDKFEKWFKDLLETGKPKLMSEINWSL